MWLFSNVISELVGIVTLHTVKCVKLFLATTVVYMHDCKHLG